MTQIQRDHLYYKLSNWKDARQWGWFLLIRLWCFQREGMLPPERKPQNSISWCPAPLSPVTWYLCVLWVGLTEEADRHVCYDFGGNKKEKYIPNSYMTAFKTNVWNTTCSWVVDRLYFCIWQNRILLNFYASYGKGHSGDCLKLAQVWILSLAFISFILWPHT